MRDEDWLLSSFEAHRTHLRTVAFRILGSLSDAEDAVQEAWLRLSRADASDVENIGGWLTTVVARISLNMLQSRNRRREDPQGANLPEDVVGASETLLPEDEALLADSVGPALIAILDTLDPPARLAFVLHDMFAVPFEELATIVGRSPAATRQLASRARRRVQGMDVVSDDGNRQREIVSAFLAASREGNFDALLVLLDPEVQLRADDAVVRMGGAARVHGALAVAETFRGRAKAAVRAWVDGRAGAMWVVDGIPRVVFQFDVQDGLITAIEMISDPDAVRALDLEAIDPAQ